MEQNGALIAVIGDEETVTGMLLAGVGNVDARRTSNFMVVDSSELPLRTLAAALAPTPFLTSARARLPAETTPPQIEDAFKRFTSRSDVAIVLINQYVRLGPVGCAAAAAVCRGQPPARRRGAPCPPRACARRRSRVRSGQPSRRSPSNRRASWRSLARRRSTWRRATAMHRLRPMRPPARPASARPSSGRPSASANR